MLVLLENLLQEALKIKQLQRSQDKSGSGSFVKPCQWSKRAKITQIGLQTVCEM